MKKGFQGIKLFVVIIAIIAGKSIYAQKFDVDLKIKSIEKLSNGNLLVYGITSGVPTYFRTFLLDKDLNEVAKGEVEVHEKSQHCKFEKVIDGHYFFCVVNVEFLTGHIHRIEMNQQLQFVKKSHFTITDIRNFNNPDSNTYVSYMETGMPGIFVNNQDLKKGCNEKMNHGEYTFINGFSFRGEKINNCVIENRKENAELFINKKFKVSGEFEVYKRMYKIQLVKSRNNYVDYYLPDTGDYVYPYCIVNPEKKDSTSFGVIYKVNYKTGEIVFKHEFSFVGSAIFDIKLSFVQDEIFVSGNLMDVEILKEKFKGIFIKILDLKTGKLKRSKQIPYGEISQEFISKKPNTRLKLYNVQKFNGQYLLYADLGEYKIYYASGVGDKMGPSGAVQPVYSVPTLSTDYTPILLSYIELDTTLSATKVENVKLVEPLLSEAVFGGDMFYDVFKNSANSQSLFLIMYSGESKTFRYLFYRNSTGLNLSELPTNESFKKENKLTGVNYLVRNENSLYEIGLSKTRLIIQIKKI